MSDAVRAHQARRVSRRGMLAGGACLAAAGSLAGSGPSAVAASPQPAIENDDELERA